MGAVIDEYAPAGGFRRRLRLELKRLLPSSYFLDVSADTRGTVLLAGSGRSGTSWIPDAINVRGDYRYMYEPFDPWHVPMMRSWRLRQYLRPDDTDPRFVEPARRIFSGRLRNGWVDEFSGHGIFRKRIVKDVLLMLALKWVRERFPAMPIVLLVRHPMAVAASRAAQTSISKNFLEGDPPYWQQENLVEDHLRGLLPIIRNATDDFDRHVACWCVENYVALRQLADDDVHLAFYERFCDDPRGELKRLFAFLGRPFDERALDVIAKPSIQARAIEGGPTSAVLSGEDPIESWRKRVSPEQRVRARRMLDAFGLDALYGERSMPVEGAAEQLFSELKRR